MCSRDDHPPYRDICQTCGRYIREVHACDPTQCTARFQGRDWCQTPTNDHDDDHHDSIGTGPWLRWCDDPDNCERPDCDLSAFNVRKDARQRAQYDALREKGLL
jgi:hypothetical protein